MSQVHRSQNTTGSHLRAGDPTDPEAIVRVVFEKSPLLVYITDLDFKVVLFNRALRDATGYDTADCPNVDALLRRFYPDDSYRGVVEAIHQGFVRNEHIRDAELVATMKEGGHRTISWSTSRLRIGRGPTVGYIALGVDVTTRRNLQQWVSIFQTSLRHLQEGVVMTEPTGKVLAWSDGARRLLGYPDEEMQGRNLGDLYLRAEREIIARTVDRAIESEGRYSGEVELEHQDGRTCILVFDQFRIDGDGGMPLARLTLLRQPGMDWEARSAELQAEVTGLHARIEDAEGAIRERDALLEGLQRDGVKGGAQVDVLRTEVEAARARADAAEEQVRALEQAAAEHASSTAERLAAVEDHAAEAEAAVHASEAEIAAARDEAQAAHLAAEAAKVAAEEEAEGLRERIAAMEGRLTDAEAAAARAAELEASHAALEAARAELEARSTAIAVDLDAARMQLDALKDAAEVARDEATAAAAAGAERAAALEASLSEAVAARDEADAKVAELEAARDAAEEAGARALQAARDEAEAEQAAAVAKAEAAHAEALSVAETRNAELQARIDALEAAAAATDTDAVVRGLEDRIAALRAEGEEAREAWVQERSQLEDSHRKALDAQQERARVERSELEGQLSRDILAAEERADAERTKLVKQHEMERRNLEDAIAIARAEAESEWKGKSEVLRAQLERSGALQPHLVPVVSGALIAADTDGRIIGWSGGAELLDGRSEADALGKTIHQDVVRLEGIKWKSLFGKVVVEGVVEEEVTLLTADGEARDVLLKAAIVKDAGGKLLGVTEVLVPPELRGDPSLHAQAAFGRLALPLHRALEARALSGLDSHRRTAAAVQDLRRLGTVVVEESGWADVLATARSIALPELLEATGELVRAADDSWLELRATAQDLGVLGVLLEDEHEGEVRWNDIVGRCLYAVQARGGGATVTREFGDGGSVRARTDRLVPLLLLLLEPLAQPGHATVRTAVVAGEARVEIEGMRPAGPSLGVARALARELSGVVRVQGDVLVATVPVDPPSSAASPTFALDGDGDRTELIGEDVIAQVAAAEGEVSGIVDVGPAADSGLVVESLAADEDEAIAAAPVDEDDEDADLEPDDDDDVTQADPTGDDDPASDDPASDRASEDPTDDGVEELDPDAPPPKGSVEFLAEGEFGDLLLAAGEDSVIAPLSEIASDLIDAPRPDPGIDDLEEVFLDGDTGVSPDLLAQAAEMDAWAEQRGGDDRMDDEDAAPASSELVAEMSSTDTGERLGAAAKNAGRGGKKRRVRKPRKKS
jgi:PAS domain S-box-containing protein